MQRATILECVPDGLPLDEAQRLETNDVLKRLSVALDQIVNRTDADEKTREGRINPTVWHANDLDMAEAERCLRLLGAAALTGRRMLTQTRDRIASIRAKSDALRGLDDEREARRVEREAADRAETEGFAASLGIAPKAEPTPGLVKQQASVVAPVAPPPDKGFMAGPRIRLAPIAPPDPDATGPDHAKAVKDAPVADPPTDKEPDGTPAPGAGRSTDARPEPGPRPVAPRTIEPEPTIEQANAAAGRPVVPELAVVKSPAEPQRGLFEPPAGLGRSAPINGEDKATGGEHGDRPASATEGQGDGARPPVGDVAGSGRAAGTRATGRRAGPRPTSANRGNAEPESGAADPGGAADPSVDAGGGPAD